MSQEIKIAFLGLGIMGGHMSANLSKAGYKVTGYNRNPNRIEISNAKSEGVKIVHKVKEAVTNAQYIISCVSDVPDVKEIYFGNEGAIHYAEKGALFIDMSTIGGSAAKEIHNQLREKDFRFVDAPVTGGDIGAQTASLTIMVGGNENDYKECEPILKCMGKRVVRCGEVGNGQALKLCNQVLVTLNMIGLCEALTLAEKQNLNPNLVIDVCNGGAGGSWALANLGPKILNSDLKPAFPIKHLLKDLSLVKELANDKNFEIPGTINATEIFKKVDAELGTQGVISAYKN